MYKWTEFDFMKLRAALEIWTEYCNFCVIVIVLKATRPIILEKFILVKPFFIYFQRKHRRLDYNIFSRNTARFSGWEYFFSIMFGFVTKDLWTYHHNFHRTDDVHGSSKRGPGVEQHPDCAATLRPQGATDHKVRPACRHHTVCSDRRHGYGGKHRLWT